MAKKRYYDTGSGPQMIDNDESKVANMPTETKIMYYPENPSYYPDTEIDDTMRGADNKSRRFRGQADLIKGMVD